LKASHFHRLILSKLQHYPSRNHAPDKDDLSREMNKYFVCYEKRKAVGAQVGPTHLNQDAT
jgi:hypothetical protein